MPVEVHRHRIRSRLVDEQHVRTYRTTSTDAHKAVTLQARGKLSVRNLSPQVTICSSRGSLVVLTCPNKLCQHGGCGKLLHTGGRKRD